MATWYLGESFDIHGGGLDLQFPHHENEAAQAHAAGDGFAQYWLHNGWVTMSGEKMSKSLGNVLSVPAILADVRPVELRYYLGSAHYRSMLEYSPAALQEAAVGYRRIETFVLRVAQDLVDGPPADLPVGAPTGAFTTAMDNDLAVPAALAEIHNAVRAGNAALAAGNAETAVEMASTVRAMADVLGVDPLSAPWLDSAETADSDGAMRALDVVVSKQLDERARARADKDYATADAIRDALAAAGIEIQDTAEGHSWTLAARAAE